MKQSICKAFRLIILILRNSLKQACYYKSSILLSFFFSTLFILSEWLLIDVYYQFTDTIGDWDRHSFYILVGSYNIMQVLYIFFFELGLEELAYKIRMGDLDTDLIRPFDTQFISAFYRFDIAALTNLILPCILIYKGVEGSHSALSVFSSILFFVNIIFGVTLIYLVNQLTVNFSFWFGMVNNLYFAADQAVQLGSKPIQVYPKAMQLCMGVLFPIALSTSLSRDVIYNTVSWKMIGMLVLGTSILFIIVRIQWKLGLKRYQSAN